MAVETEGGGSDRNSLSIKKKKTERWRETDTVNQRDNEPEIEERGGGVALKALAICDEELEEQ